MNIKLAEIEDYMIKNLQHSNNLKNEVEKKELEKKDQLKEICLSIIDILDSFERVEESLREKGVDNNEVVVKVQNKYKSIQKKLLNLLQKHGVSKIDFPDGRLIVGLCRVVETEPDSSKPNDSIVTIIRNGYIRGTELIREAEVIVVKN